MSSMRIHLLTLFAMIAFAGNSLLCRLALKNSGIDPASFSSIRIVSGAFVLWLIVTIRGGTHNYAGSWLSALALFTYAAGFSFAYVSLPASTGSLLLFGAVQATMISRGLWAGERLRSRQIVGLICAFGGLVGLLLPGLTAPPLFGSILMLGAGLAWGIYSLRGAGVDDPLDATAGNFLYATVFAAGLSVIMLPWSSLNLLGIWYAMLSGSLASGVGYAIWYTALRGLKATSAASVQLSVPVIAAVGGIAFLGETLTLRLVIASIAVLGGVALVIFDRQSLR
jgi:drug/metabolite transporter (DMT)-like permease